MYIRPETNQTFITHSEIRSAFPGVSFPSEMRDEILAEHGVFPVITLDPPEFDSATHTTDLSAPSFNAQANRWERYHSVRVYNQQETDAKAKEVRATRDKRLAETDWIIVKCYEKNQNVPSEWEVYRQALRDIPEQVGFPYEIAWPAKP